MDDLYNFYMYDLWLQLLVDLVCFIVDLYDRMAVSGCLEFFNGCQFFLEHGSKLWLVTND